MTAHTAQIISFLHRYSTQLLPVVSMHSSKMQTCFQHVKSVRILMIKIAINLKRHKIVIYVRQCQLTISICPVKRNKFHLAGLGPVPENNIHC